MQPTPYISVVITTHHRPQLLERCLLSLRDQDFEDFEIVLCADESSAATREVAARHLRERDAFLVLPRLPGPAATRNAGVAVSRGQWVCFLDDDDRFDSMHLELSLPSLQHDRASVHFCNFERIREQRDGPSPVTQGREQVSLATLPAPLLVRNSIPNNAYFVPRTVAQACRVDESLPSHEDWDYLLQLQAVAPLVHHDRFGPCVHVADPSRQGAAVADGSSALDYLSIYRRWPAPDDTIRGMRAQYMAAFGLPLDTRYL